MFESVLSNGITMNGLMICTVTSLILGVLISLVYKYTTNCRKNFLITLLILPLLIQSIIVMSNGNIGISVAILGAFSLIRFRSIPGTSKEITAIFFCMTIGVGIGLGLILYTVMLTIIVLLIMIVLNKIKYGNDNSNKILKVTIPEDLDYQEEFKEVFSKYLKSYELERVKTVNLGSLYELTFSVILKDKIDIKEFIDDLRIRNNNLKIILRNTLETGDL